MENSPLTSTPQPVQQNGSPRPDNRDIDENKDIAALSYAWALSVFVFFFKHNSPYVRFHAKQGIVLFVLSIIFWFVPVVGRFLELFVLIGIVVGFLSAAQGQWREIPLVYAIANGDVRALRTSWKDSVQGIVTLWRKVVHRTSKSAAEPAHSSGTETPPPSEQ